ncbi:hypothetical protein BH11ACT6_BH11ACT6_34690 [soil metagenome]
MSTRSHTLDTNQTVWIAKAEQLLIDASCEWAISATTTILGIPIPDVPDVDDKYLKMCCAAAILAWEQTKASRLGITPGAPWYQPAQESAVYDDETLAELLGSIR